MMLQNGKPVRRAHKDTAPWNTHFWNPKLPCKKSACSMISPCCEGAQATGTGYMYVLEDMTGNMANHQHWLRAQEWRLLHGNPVRPWGNPSLPVFHTEIPDIKAQRQDIILVAFLNSWSQNLWAEQNDFFFCSNSNRDTGDYCMRVWENWFYFWKVKNIQKTIKNNEIKTWYPSSNFFCYIYFRVFFKVVKYHKQSWSLCLPFADTTLHLAP